MRQNLANETFNKNSTTITSDYSDIENVIIVGSGPASYAAALFASEKNPIMFEGEYDEEIGPGGQLTTTTVVDNYPGFPKGTTGPELMETMRSQAKDKGIKIITKKIEKIEKSGNIFLVYDSADNIYKTYTVIVGTGSFAKRLYVPGTNDNEFWQKGISACAVCDGFFAKNKIVAVIGGGDSAFEEATYLSNIAKKVYLIHRRNEFRARSDKQTEIKKIENIEILTPYELLSAHGDKRLNSIKIKNKETGESMNLDVEGLFFAIGHIPNTNFLNGLVELDNNNYIKTDHRMQTNVPGIFACGDVQDHVYRQAVTAADSGAVAGLECLKYLANL